MIAVDTFHVNTSAKDRYVSLSDNKLGVESRIRINKLCLLACLDESHISEDKNICSAEFMETFW